ncbi:MAG TPA: EamA family transporter [Candidatus Acidoferrales bacterium]|nr:EamA family transporter [Candidatus Acidoferrales bacterium]
MQTALFVLLVAVAGTSGEMFVSRAMKSIGEVTSFRPEAIARVVVRALASAWMWAGLGMMALAFFSLLVLLSGANVSFVVQVTALSYVMAALGGRFFLGEHVNANRWLGVCLVCAGVALVWAG